MYRPKGWENPFGTKRPEVIYPLQIEYDAFETGADTMLRMLRAIGKICDGISPILYCPDGCPGRLVFIPEEIVEV